MLPRIENEDVSRDAEALAAAVQEALKPVASEIEDLVKTMRKNYPDAPERQFRLDSLQYTVDRLREAVEDMTKTGSEVVTPADVVGMLDGFAEKTASEQQELLGTILKNSEFQSKLLDQMERVFVEDMTKNLDKLVDIELLGQKDSRAAREALAKIEAERDRKLNRERDVGRGRVSTDKRRDESVLDKLLDFLDSSSPRSLFSGISAFVSDMGLLIGAGGLLSLVPKKVREFVDEYVTAFAEVKLLLQASWLNPMVKILEHLPILGSIVKKLPVLSGVLAAFDVLPRVFEKYKTDGWWAALESGLSGLSKFFVSDVVGLVGKLADYVEREFFSVDLFDFSSLGDSMEKMLTNASASVTKSLKLVFEADLVGAVENVAVGLKQWLEDTVNLVLGFLKKPQDWDVDEEIEKLVGSVKRYATSLTAWVSASVSGALDAVTKKMTSIKDAVVYGVISARDEVVGVVDGAVSLVTDVWEAVKKKISDSFSAALDAVVDLKRSMEDWFTKTIEDFKNSIIDSVPGLRSIVKPDEIVPYDQSSASAPVVLDETKTDKTKKREIDLVKKTLENRKTMQEMITRPLTQPNPAAIIDNRKQSSSHVNNWNVSGPTKASPRGPLSTSSGW